MNERMKITISSCLVFLAIIWSLFVPSTIFELLGLPGFAISLLVMVLTLIICLCVTVHKKIIFIIVGVFSFSFILLFKWGDMRYIISPISISLSFLIISLFNQNGLRSFLNFSSYFLLLILIGCWFGFSLSLATGGAEIKLFNVFGRDYYFYLTTFTVVKNNEFIRPSGIYLEPGHLIWILASLLCIRRIYEKNLRLTVTLLILGFITFSLAYIIFSVFFILSLLNIRNAVLTILIGVLSFSIIIFSPLGEYSKQYIYERFESTDGGEAIKGDNRSFRMVNAYEILANDPSVLITGIGAKCYFEPDSCRSEIGLYGENPLTPLVGLGIFNSFIYYYMLLAVLVLSIRNRRISVMMAIGITAIYAQQPINLQLGYSFWPLLLLHNMRNRNIL
ncbi:hypothetical protein ACIPMZ_02210 [Scandinavium goeteborgense]|uniref:hypothetical protein n=1 Tax=Scandinavium goeteborgense TaxID=1851514 RepID=UPI0038285D6B